MPLEGRSESLFGGFYVSGKFGMSYITAADIANTTSVPAGTTPAPPTKKRASDIVIPFGAAIGYNWDRHGMNLRSEMEFVHRAGFGHEANPSFTSAAVPTSFTSKLRSQTLMFNVYYDFKDHSSRSALPFLANPKLIAYLGGGLGMAWNNTNTYGQIIGTPGVTEYREYATSLAWNVTAGVYYNLKDHMALDFGYRYVDLGEARWGSTNVAQLTPNSLSAHEVLASVRYQF
jgi:opacity protein-like surface antigen